MADLLSMSPPFLFLAFVLVELALRPARPYARMRFWRLRGLAYFAVTGVIATCTPLLLAEPLSAHRLLDLTGLGLLGGAAVAYLAGTFVNYWVHRGFHRFQPLWRMHQMHHAAERIDIWSVSINHPLEMIFGGVVSSVLLVSVLGVTPEAAALVGALGPFQAFLEHANVRTPRLLGFLVQRPESHNVHHQRGVHAFNYSDFPLWDVLFGTFRNPEAFDAPVGFYEGASERVLDMLLGRDVTVPASYGPPMTPRPSDASTMGSTELVRP